MEWPAETEVGPPADQFEYPEEGVDMSGRPNKRVLVRWNDDHDKELLLWIVYCCNEQGMKIPWVRIAQCMGPEFTEGACTQHIAKIRAKMEEEGLHVPPPSKRGVPAKSGSSIYGTKVKPINAPPPRMRPDVPRPKTIGASDEEEEIENGNYIVPGQKRVLSKVKSADPRQDPKKNVQGGSYRAALTAEMAENTEGHKGMRLRHGGKTVAPAQYGGFIQTADDTDEVEIANVGSGVSVEDVDSVLEGFAEIPDISASPLPARGTRRRINNNVMNNDEDEYEPSPPAMKHVRRINNRRVAKRTKQVASKGKLPKAPNSAKLNSITFEGIPVQDLPNYNMQSQPTPMQPFDHDRAAMPPPPVPAMHNNAIGWNGNIMQAPFSSPTGYSSAQGTDFNHGSWNDYQAANDYIDNSQHNYAQNFNEPNDTAHYYAPNDMMQQMSAVSSRNHSFASATSGSTIQTQPNNWNQPRGHPNLANPFMVPQMPSTPIMPLAEMNFDDHSMYGPSMNIVTPHTSYGQRNANMYGERNHSYAIDEVPNQHIQTVNNGHESMFVNEPELHFDDFVDSYLEGMQDQTF